MNGKAYSFKTVLFWVTLAVTGIGFVLLFSWVYRAGMARYFDVDEFTYLHWVELLSQGKKPYFDFFFLIPPTYLFFYLPVVLLAGKTAFVFLAGRIFSLGVAFALFTVSGLIFGTVRSWKYAFLPSLLVAFLPMPSEKFFEIRPDTLAILFAFVAMLFHILWLNGKKEKGMAFLAGASYTLSVLIMQKTVPFAFVAFIVYCIQVLDVVKNKKISGNPIWYFPLGGVIVGGLLSLYLLLLGDVGTIYYSLVRIALEAYSAVPYIMEAHLYFFPNASFYGGAGFSNGFIFNHILWGLGICMGVYRLFTPGITQEGKKKGMLAEILLAGSFILVSGLYVSYYPMKHPQYLEPIAVFVGFYAADAIVLFFTKLEKKISILPLILLILGIGVLYSVSGEVNGPKLQWNNTMQLDQLTTLQQTIPSNLEVFDLEGRMIFWPQPYYICCLAIGDFYRNLSQKPPTVSSILEKRKVPYIYQGDSRRLYTLPYPDRQYIQDNYAPVVGWGDTIWERK
jgi:hypothetical protein